MTQYRAVILVVFITTALQVVATDMTRSMATRFSTLWHYNPQEKIYLHTDKPYYSSGEDLWFKAYLVNAATHQPTTQSRFIYVELLDETLRLSRRVKIRRDSLDFHGKITLTPDLSAGLYTLRAYTYWMQNAGPEFFFEKKIRISSAFTDADTSRITPPTNTNFAVTFFPESGTFLNDQIQTVAFKAIGSNGLSVEVQGSVFNQDNEELLSFKSMHKGMGKIVLRTFPGESYYAMVSTGHGLVQRIDLPPTHAEGIALQLTSFRGRTNFKLMNQTSLPTEELYLMIHARGIVYIVLPFSETEGQIPESFLPAGICSYTVIDTLGNTYCERLQLIRNFDFPSITMNTNQQVYRERSPVKLSFQVLKDSLPVQGNFSVSVTDSHLVQPDTLGDNILSYLLMSSDIKGYVEEPQAYFADNSNITREKTDLLMMTQGWRRFNTADIAKGKFPESKYYMELGQTVAGRVYNLFNKPSVNTGIIMLSGYKNYIRTTTTDNTGHFMFDGIEFPDSTIIILKAQSRSRLVDVELIPETDTLPGAFSKIPKMVGHQQPVDPEYSRIVRERYYLEGGMWVIDLDEITVRADGRRPTSQYYYSGMADNTLNADRLADMAGLDIMTIFSMLPGVQVNGEEVSIRGGGTPLFVIDGIETSQREDVLYLNTNDIEEIMLFKGPSTAIFGSRGGNGVIAITLKKGAINERPTSPSLVHLSPLGFQPAAEFYVPAYEVDSIRQQQKADLRTTIYWAPVVRTNESGWVELEFFTADRDHDYRVELEGISAQGAPSRFTGILRRR